MKYVRFTKSHEVNIIMTIVFALIGVFILAYGIGYLAGALNAWFQ